VINRTVDDVTCSQVMGLA